MLTPPRSMRKRSIDGSKIKSTPVILPRVPFVLAAIICALAIPLIIMLDVRTDPSIAEWWSMHISRPLTKFFAVLTSWLPFSVLELCIVVLVALAVFLYGRLIFDLSKRKIRRIITSVLSLGVAALYVLNMYVVTMAFAYYRAPMPICQSENKYTDGEATAVVEYFLNDFNSLSAKLKRNIDGCVVCPYTFSELAERIKIEYAKLDGQYFYEYTPYAKPVVNSNFLSQMLLTGVTFLPVGEATVNVAAPPTVTTITLAHELAHTKGVAREGDANLIARYILLSSGDDYLRYCGYYATFGNLLGIFMLQDDRENYIKYSSQVSKKVFDEQRYANDYWAAQPDIIGSIAEFFNDVYLKLNGAFNGTDSYQNGNVSEVIKPVDPSTGEPVIDPDTEKPVRIIIYSQVQKMYFSLYESHILG